MNRDPALLSEHQQRVCVCVCTIIKNNHCTLAPQTFTVKRITVNMFFSVIIN